MNMLEFEREIARRTLSFLDNKTTDMADHILEDPVSVYSDPELFEEEKRLLFNRYPIFVGLTCDLPEPGSWKTYDASGTPILFDPGRRRPGARPAEHLPAPGQQGGGRALR